jgi:hypothetical protein
MKLKGDLTGMNKYLFSAVVILAILSAAVAGCGGSAQPSLTFPQLIADADKYNGQTVTFEAFDFSGFEISALAASLGPSSSNPSRIVPEGDLIWIKGGITEDLFNRLYTQSDTPSGYPEHFGKVKVTGKFETGGQYGHMNAYRYQITITSAELLEWSPPPASS